MGHDGDMWQLLLSISAAVAAPDAAALSAAWQAVSEDHAAKGWVPVSLQPSDFEQLAQGEVVRRLLPGKGVLAAQGAIYSPHPPARIWVTIQDPEHLNLAREDLPLQRLPGSTAARRLNYQMVKTPWPLADRQQVFTVEANAGLYASSGKRVWERAVALADRALAVDADPDAVTGLFADTTYNGTAVTGVAARLDTLLEDYLDSDGILDARTDSLNERLSRINDDREVIARRFELLETRYRAQFNAMDSLLSNITATGDFLAQQLKNLPGAYDGSKN